jgi:hypothetical protein
MATFTPEQKRCIQQKRCIKGHRALHLLKVFLAVTEKKQVKTGKLVLQAESEFKNHIAGDPALNDAMKSKALLGNKDLPIDGETVWVRVKEYKARIINVYQVIFKEDSPSGTTTVPVRLEVFRKKVWLKEQTKKSISKGLPQPSSWKDCPEGYLPVDWFAFSQLYDHVKLHYVDASANKENDPENKDVRKELASRKQQRTEGNEQRGRRPATKS